MLNLTGLNGSSSQTALVAENLKISFFFVMMTKVWMWKGKQKIISSLRNMRDEMRPSDMKRTWNVRESKRNFLFVVSTYLHIFEYLLTGWF